MYNKNQDNFQIFYNNNLTIWFKMLSYLYKKNDGFRFPTLTA